MKEDRIGNWPQVRGLEHSILEFKCLREIRFITACERFKLLLAPELNANMQGNSQSIYIGQLTIHAFLKEAQKMVLIFSPHFHQNGHFICFHRQAMKTVKGINSVVNEVGVIDCHFFH